MSTQPAPHVPDKQNLAEAGRFLRHISEFVGFDQADAQAIRETGLIIEKHLPAMIGHFYTHLLQYPSTRRFFLKPDGNVDQGYLELRMYHQANFWRRVAGGVYDDDFAGFVDYVGRAHTSRGADPRVYIAERYVIGMVGFIQHAVIDALHRELHDYDPELEMRGIQAWNKICTIILEMLARAYGHEREEETGEALLPVDAQTVLEMSIDSYEKGLGIRRRLDTREVQVARAEEIPEGERKIVQVNGLSIGIFHHKGNWYAIHNSCLHRGGPVAAGRLVDDHIVCPWHGYTYDLTTGELLMDPSARLDMYPVSIRDGLVYVNIPVIFESLVKSADESTEEAKGVREQSRLKAHEFYVSALKPGQIKLLHIEGKRVAVYHVDGVFYATQDECTHADGPLSEGELQGTIVTCPWHDSCFDVTTGAATCPPATEPLRTYRVRIDGEIGRVEVT